MHIVCKCGYNAHICLKKSLNGPYTGDLSINNTNIAEILAPMVKRGQIIVNLIFALFCKVIALVAEIFAI